MSFQQVTRNSGYTGFQVHSSPHACHFLPRLLRVVPSHSKGSSQPSFSPVKRRSRSESRSSAHNIGFALFSLLGFGGFYRLFSHCFWACPGSCTLEACHEYIDLSLRSPRSLTMLDAVIGAVVPTTFPSGCRGRCSRVPTALDVQPSLPTPLPLLQLFPRIPRNACTMMGNDRSRGGRGRYNAIEPWKPTAKSRGSDP
ncbi:hypothetical protein CRG98_014416 [Punica granatum]|uniref:Uncharacterized protein n=1 Tax=Punica granatum TaxID=22663 RepID=A0A2I0KBN8_PUNGR|nr:hypothetical protein CRG98_014416 [Punica granatum]